MSVTEHDDDPEKLAGQPVPDPWDRPDDEPFRSLADAPPHQDDSAAAPTGDEHDSAVR